MILVTGATGNNGLEVVKRSAKQNVPVRAMVHNRSRASAISALPNVELVEGDFDRSETVLSALAGVDRAFLLTNSTERAGARRARQTLEHWLYDAVAPLFALCEARQ